MMTRREIALKASEAARAKRLGLRAQKPGHKPGAASQFSIMPPASRPESLHVPDLTFPSSLRLGMMQTEELISARNDRETRLRQSERLAGPLKKVATIEENQLRIELISYDLELKRRALTDCQRQREQRIEHEEELIHA